MKNNKVLKSGTIGILKSDLSNKIKAQLIFRRIKGGFGNVPIYVMLVALSFIFILPFFYMIARSFMTPMDLTAGSAVKWLPRQVTLNNYKYALMGLNYLPKLWVSFYTTALCVIGQMVSCSFIAYGLARIKFKGNNLVFALVIFTLIVPPQTIIVPLYIQYAGMGWTNTFLPMIVPSFFGFGLNGGLFIFIFRQFYKGLPEELENAALIDGCGIFQSYFRIILPNTKSAFLVSTILSLVWNWNNYFEPSVYILDVGKYGNLPMQLENLVGNAGSQFSGNINGGTDMAATFLCVLPILIIFFFLQGRFMKSIDRVGLAN